MIATKHIPCVNKKIKLYFLCIFINIHTKKEKAVQT